MGGQVRRAALVAAAAFAAATAQPAAADAGLAAAFNRSGTTIIVPIRTDSWLVEPQLAFIDQKVGDQTFKATNPGIGLYYRQQAGQMFEAYYGGIVAYDQIKQTVAGTDVKQTTFSITPTVGAQHYFSKEFSIGVDAGLQYTNGKLKQTGQADQDIRVLDTVVRIVARVFFW